MDAAIFQVTYQIKILTTALFAVLILKKSLSVLQWVALVILTSGIIFVQSPNIMMDNQFETSDTAYLGLIFVLIACLISGFAGIWYVSLLF
jgi:UDP-sugar transporter A1/2/3